MYSKEMPWDFNEIIIYDLYQTALLLWHFQMQFLARNVANFDHKFTDVCKQTTGVKVLFEPIMI